MAFQLTGEVVLTPDTTSIKNVASAITTGLRGISVPINLQLKGADAKSLLGLSTKLKELDVTLARLSKSATQTGTAVDKLGNKWSTTSGKAQALAKSMGQVSQASKQATKGMTEAASASQRFGHSAAVALRRYAAFVVSSKVTFGLVGAIGAAVTEAIQFERQMVKVSQVTGTSMTRLGRLGDAITELSVKYGTSSQELVEVSRTLSQAGLTASEVKTALDTLAKTDLAPTFTSMSRTTEGYIAIMRQFKLEAYEMEDALGAVNAVAGKFAVESDDIIAAVRRTGGVFAMASKNVASTKDAFLQFISVFTSIRAATRESPESIATGLRTIITRLQRGSTIDLLESFGIELREGNQFVGAYEAIKRLGEGMDAMLEKGNDLRVMQIGEVLGGFRQVGKTLPMLTEATTRIEALKVAQEGMNSLEQDSVEALKAMSVNLQRVTQDFKALIREFVLGDVFKSTLGVVTGLSHAFLGMSRSFQPMIPILAAVAGFKMLGVAHGFGKGFMTEIKSVSQVGKQTVSAVATQKQALVTHGQQVRSNVSALQANTIALNKMSIALGVTRSVGKWGGMGIVGKGGIKRKAAGGSIGGSGNRDTQLVWMTPGEFVIRKDAAQALGPMQLQQLNHAEKLPRFVDGGGDIPPARHSGFYSSHRTAAKNRFSQEGFFGKKLDRAMLGWERSLKNQTASGVKYIDNMAAINAGLVRTTKDHTIVHRERRKQIRAIGKSIKGRLGYGGGLPLMLGAGMATEQFIGRETPGAAATSSSIQGAIGAGFMTSLMTANPLLIAGAAVAGGVSAAEQAHAAALVTSANRELQTSIKELREAFNNLASGTGSVEDLAEQFKQRGKIAARATHAQFVESRTKGATSGKLPYAVGVRTSSSLRDAAKAQAFKSSSIREVISNAIVGRPIPFKPLVGSTFKETPIPGMFTKKQASQYDANMQNAIDDQIAMLRTTTQPEFQMGQALWQKEIEKVKKQGFSEGSLWSNVFQSKDLAPTMTVMAKHYGQQSEIEKLTELEEKLQKTASTSKKKAIQIEIDNLSRWMVAHSGMAAEFLEQRSKQIDMADILRKSNKQLDLIAETFKNVGAKAKYIAGAFGEIGQIQIRTGLAEAGLQNTLGGIPQANVFQNMRGTPAKVIQDTLNKLPLSLNLKEVVMASKNLQTQFPDIVREVFAAGGHAAGEPPVTDIMDKVRKIKGFDKLPSSISKVLKDSIEKLFTTSRKGGKLTDVQFKSVMDKISIAFREGREAASDVNEAMIKIRSEFLKSLESAMQMRIQITQAAAASAGRFAGMTNQRNALFGNRRLTFDELQKPNLAQERHLAIAGGMDLAPGARPGVGAIKDKIKELTKSIRMGEAAMLAGENVDITSRSLQRDTAQRGNLQNLLKLIARNTSPLDAIKQDMAHLRKKRAAGQGAIMSIFQMDPMERAKFGQNLTHMAQFQDTGVLPKQVKDIQGLLSVLPMLSGLMDPAKMEKLRADLTKALLGFAGVGPLNKKGLGGMLTESGGVEEQEMLGKWNEAAKRMQEAADAIRNIRSERLDVTTKELYINFNKKRIEMWKEPLGPGGVKGIGEAADVLQDSRLNRVKDILNGIKIEREAIKNSTSEVASALREVKLSIPEKIELAGTHIVEVRINGAEAFQTMKPELQSMIVGTVRQEFAKHVDLTTGEPRGIGGMA